MNTIYRRTFLLSTTALIPACASFNQKIDAIIQGIIEYGQALYNGLKSMWLQIQPLPQIQNLDENIKSTITTGGKIVGDLLTSLSNVQNTAQAQPIVAKIMTYAQAVLSALITIPGLPPTVITLIGATQIVLPVLASLVGLAVATIAQVQAATEAKAILLSAPVQ